MRRSVLTTMVAVLLLAIPGTTSASEDARTISVNGEAEVRVTPDQVVITLGIQSFDEVLDAAKTQNDAAMTDLLEVTANQGIAAEDVATDYLTIEPRIRNDHDIPRLVGYQVRRTVVITLKETEKFESLLSAALEAGVNFVHGVDFRTTELRAHRDRARDLAVLAAREKAEALAGSLDQSIGKPISITEGHMGWWSPYASWGGRFRGGMSQNVSASALDPGSSWEGPTPPGQIAVTARVSVTFALED